MHIEELSENSDFSEIPIQRSHHVKHKSTITEHKHLFHNYDFNEDKYNINHNYIVSPSSPVIKKKSHE